MPQPAEVDRIAAEVVALWQDSHASLLAELAEVIDEPSEVRRAARIRELLKVNGVVLDELNAGTREWLAAKLPEVHALGAARAAEAVGSAFAWTQPHVDAVQALAAQTWGEVAPNLREVRASSRTAIRSLTRDSVRSILLEGQTGSGASRALEAAANRAGLWSVTYGNGARVGMGDYADMLARTVSANAYNAGTLTQTIGDGFEWVEIFDGPDCGWTSHADPDKANGTVRPVADAVENSISHPRCARSFAPAVGVTSQAEADRARRYTDDEQAQMAADEAARAAVATTTLTGRPTAAAVRAREARAVRTSRSTRSPRTPRTVAAS